MKKVWSNREIEEMNALREIADLLANRDPNKRMWRPGDWNDLNRWTLDRVQRLIRDHS